MKKLIMLLVLLCSPLTVSVAAEVNNLYDAEVQVASQSPQDRNAAISQALAQVLVKVTGNAAAARQSALNPLLSNASQYVLKFTYRLSESSDEELRFIRVYFDALSVNQQIRQAGLPVWGTSRPQLIVWVGVQQGRSREMLMPDTNPAISGGIRRLADQYGIPVLMPLMDLEDQSAVTTSDLWGSFSSPLQKASSRYLSDLIVVLRLNTDSKGYTKSSWSMVANNDSTDWNINAASLDEALSQGMQKLAGLVAAAYAPAGGNSVERINIQIGNVNNFAALVKTQRYLQNLESVESLLLRSLGNGNAVMTVNLRGGLQSFEQAVSLSGFIEPATETLQPIVMQAPTPVIPVEQVQPQISGATPLTLPQEPQAAQPGAVLDEISLYYELNGRF